MLAVEVIDLHSFAYVLPERSIEVDIIINRLEHSAYNALGKSSCVAGEEVDAFAAQNICRKVRVYGVPCSGIPLDLSAVFALEERNIYSLGVTLCCRRIDVIVSKPLDGLVLKLNVLKFLVSHFLKCCCVLFCQSSSVKFNGSCCSSGSSSSLFSGSIGTAVGRAVTAAGCHAQSKGKSRDSCKCLLKILHIYLLFYI